MNLTAVAPRKLVPVRVTSAPAGPEVGLIRVTVGGDPVKPGAVVLPRRPRRRARRRSSPASSAGAARLFRRWKTARASGGTEL